MTKFQHQALTSDIIKAYYKVYNTLGYGFLEKVYEKSLVLELQKNSLKVVPQKQINIQYKGHRIGHYFADLLVEDTVIVEVKAAEMVQESHEAQLINYLKASDLEVGLLLNFGKEAEIKRKVYSNNPKNPYQHFTDS